MPPGQQIETTGYNVFRINSGPYFLLFNESSISVGSNIVVDIDSRLLSTASPTVSSTLADTDAFKLVVSSQPGTPRCQMVIDQAAWTFSDRRYRPFLVAAFDSFLQQCEVLENNVLQPGASAVLRAVAAQWVPSTFAENLYFAHGVFSQDNPGQTYFDLQPGMRLRLDFQARQFVPPTGGPGPLSGFVGGPAVTADVVGTTDPSGVPKIGIDAFLSAVRLPPIPDSTGGFGDLIDLAAKVGPGQRHIRFCYPPQFFAADSGGGASASGNIAVLSAPDLVTLAKATAAYYATGAPGAALLGFFRGRTAIQPQIPVLVGGTGTHFVPLGTTARQLLERFAAVPRIPGFLDAGASTALNYQRRRSVLDISSLYGSDSYAPVTLAGADLDPSGADAFDFPVLAADVFHPPTGLDHA